MTLRMHRQFITTIAAASIAITGFSAAPARAGDQDVGAALAAILGLAIVGAVIKDKHDNRKARQQVHTPQHVAPVTRHKPQVKPLPNRVNRKLLPQNCLYTLSTHRGPARVFGQRCLNQNYRHVNSLPRACHRQLNTQRGLRQGYSAHCLNQHGYQLARR
ncbi:MAG: hypothetical protein AAF214_10335 [Pseudomonadota bacterium]